MSIKNDYFNKYFLIIFLFPFIGYSQVNQVDAFLDSISNVVESESSIEEKSMNCYNAAFVLYRSENDLSLEYAQSGLDHALSADFDKGVIKNSIILAANYFERDSLSKAVVILESLEPLKQRDWEYFDIGNYHLYRALIYETIGSTTAAIEQNLLGLDATVLDGDTLGTGMFYNNLSGLYANSNSVEKSIESQKLALENFILVNHIQFITNSYLNLSNYFIQFELYDSALVYLNMAKL